MNNRSGAKSLVFGGMMAALTVVLVYLVPFPMVYPVPLVLVYVRYGIRPALISGAAASLLILFMLGWVQGVLMVPLVILPALTMGHGVTQRLSPLVTVAATSVTAFIARLLNFGLAFLLMGQNPIELMIKSQQEAMEMSRDLMVKISPANDPNVAAMKQVMDLTIEMLPSMMMLLLPALLLLGSIFAALLVYMVCRWTLPRFGHHIEPLRPFREWQAPNWLNWIFLSGLGLMLAAYFLGPHADWLRRMGINLAMAAGFVYMTIGCAVAYYWLSNRVAKGLAIAALVFAFMMLGGFAMLAMLFLGMWDPSFDFRKLRMQTQGGNQS